MENGLQTGPIWGVYGALFAFGILYALLVHHLRREYIEEGYTSLLVVFGVGVTLLAASIVHQDEPHLDLLIELGAFAASGLPMVIESTLSYAITRRKQEQADHQRIHDALVREQVVTGSGGGA